jgi:hypothetical protein
LFVFLNTLDTIEVAIRNAHLNQRENVEFASGLTEFISAENVKPTVRIRIPAFIFIYVVVTG